MPQANDTKPITKRKRKRAASPFTDELPQTVAVHAARRSSRVCKTVNYAKFASCGGPGTPSSDGDGARTDASEGADASG